MTTTCPRCGRRIAVYQKGQRAGTLMWHGWGAKTGGGPCSGTFLPASLKAQP